MNWTYAFWIALTLVPPVGILIHWFRPGLNLNKRVYYTMPMLLWTFAWLVAFWGLTVEIRGEGSPTLTFKKGDPVEALERDRASQAAAPAPAAPSPIVDAKPAPATESKPTPIATPHWPSFRGPAGDGKYTETPILTQWPAVGLTQLWRHPIGGGYASFVVAQGRAYTIEQRRDKEVASAYDLSTGRELWTSSWPTLFQESMGGDGPRATPTFNDGKLYALGAAGEFRALNAATGKTIWRVNILEDNSAPNLQWAMSAAPLIVDGNVVVQPGGPSGRSIVAYNKTTGARAWSVLDDKAAYATPILATLAGKRQILAVTATRMVALDPATGALLWECPWQTAYDVNASSPLPVGPNRVFISAGYGHGGAVIEVTADGDKLAARTVWANNRMKNKFSTSVYHDGHIYGMDESILACVDASTGDLKWKGGRYGFGQLLLAQGHLIVTTESGEAVLVKATPASHQQIAQFPAVDGKTWNVPAIAGGKLLVRNQTEMAAFQLAP